MTQKSERIKKMEIKEKVFRLILVITAAAAAGAGGTYLANKEKIDFMNRYPLLLETKEFTEDKMEIKLPEDPGNEAVINSLLALYGDKYTKFEAKKDIYSEEFVNEQINRFSTAKGSGFRIKFSESGEPYFSAVYEDMPAYQQGIREGDIIVSIDGEKITEPKNIKKLNGRDGTVAELVLRRDVKEMNISFKRSSDELGAEGGHIEMYGKTLYLALDEFGDTLMKPLEEELDKNDFDRIVLDLRGNIGGSIDIGIKFADLFAGAGNVNFYSYSGENTTMSTSDNVKYKCPIVILTDKKTMSAAEMVTALLKQYADTTIVGTATYGKDEYQQSGFFSDGILEITAGKVTVGTWESYAGTGIKPDIEIDMSFDDIGTERDIQFKKAMEIISQN